MQGKRNKILPGPQAYSDPDASWGWDSYRGCWFYGRHLYYWNAADSPYDLPVYFWQVAARRHDSVSGVVPLDECQRLHAEWTVGAVSSTPLMTTIRRTSCFTIGTSLLSSISTREQLARLLTRTPTNQAPELR